MGGERSPEVFESRHSPEREPSRVEHEREIPKHPSDIVLRWLIAFEHGELEMPDWLVDSSDDHCSRCDHCDDREQVLSKLPMITPIEIFTGVHAIKLP